MKLKKIVMSGFMRFHEKTEVNFSQGQITLIAGENGSGKTTILEALCLALYGKTCRISGKPTSGYLNIDDLINHGSEKASIEVEFENFGHNYVVKRAITKKKSTGEIFEDGVPEPKAIGNKVFEYVEKRAIGLDWEGFRKSTVVLQGEMNSLTQVQPAVRKDAFKKLFGLERYTSIYDEMAKQKILEKESSKKSYEEVNKILTADVNKIPQLTSNLQNAKKNLTSFKQKKTDLNRTVRTKSKQKAVLEKTYSKYGQIKERCKNIEVNLNNNNSSIFKTEKEIKRLEQIQTELPALQQSYIAADKLQKKHNKLKPIKSKFDELTQNFNQTNNLKKQKENYLSNLNSETSTSLQKIDDLTLEIPKQSTVNTAQKNCKRIKKKKSSIEQLKATLDAELGSISKQLKDLQKKQVQVEGQNRCPVCLRDITDPKQIAEHFRTEKKRLNSQQKTKQKSLAETSAKLLQVTEESEQLSNILGELQNRLNKKNLLLKEKEILKQTRQKQKIEIANIEKLSKNLKKQTAALSRLNFDSEGFDADEKQLDFYTKQKVIENFSKATTEIKTLPRIHKDLDSLKKMSSSLKIKLTASNLRLKPLGNIEEEYKTAQSELKKAQDEFNKNEQEITKETTNQQNLEYQLKELNDKKDDLNKNKTKIEKLAKEIILYTDLRNIFKNIPDNILRRLSPYIEKEGNNVITALSENDITALNIQAETLNVAATSLGEIRPIQYFSEGQKTRINLSLRIAISRILSKLPQTEDHAYAVMQTLFIDEGDFGSLDEPGIRDTVSVMRNLSQEFDRVILISHVPSLKDIFQGQVLQVAKTGPETSKITISNNEVL